MYCTQKNHDCSRSCNKKNVFSDYIEDTEAVVLRKILQKKLNLSHSGVMEWNVFRTP